MNLTQFFVSWIAALALGGRLSCSGMQNETPIARVSIPPDMRAVSVRVNEASGIVPGRRVDVLVTSNSKSPTEWTATILQDAAVVAYEQVKPNVGVVTLLTSPKDAENLTLASQNGKIVLVPHI